MGGEGLTPLYSGRNGLTPYSKVLDAIRIKL
jgi:hypothetical protein